MCVSKTIKEDHRDKEKTGYSNPIWATQNLKSRIRWLLQWESAGKAEWTPKQ